MKRLGAAIASMLLVGACASEQPATTAKATLLPSAASTSAPASFEDVQPGTRLAAGTYVLKYDSIGGADNYPTLAFTFTVPDGWSRVEIDGVVWGEAGTRLKFEIADNLFVDPCDPARGLRDPAVGPSVDDLATALSTVAGWDVTSSAAGTFHGFNGKRVEMTGPSDVASCGDGESRLLHSRGSPGYSLASTNGERHDLRILDVAGTRVVVDAINTGDAKAEASQQLQSIVDSVQIQP